MILLRTSAEGHLECKYLH